MAYNQPHSSLSDRCPTRTFADEPSPARLRVPLVAVRLQLRSSRAQSLHIRRSKRRDVRAVSLAYARYGSSDNKVKLVRDKTEHS